MKKTLISCLALAAFNLADAGIPTPSAEKMRHYSRELDYLEKTFFADQRKGEQFGDHFERESKRVAARNDPNIIVAILQRARRWQDEEGLIFVPLVSALPRKSTLAVLHQFERSARESDRVWAHEFIIEFEMQSLKPSQ